MTNNDIQFLPDKLLEMQAGFGESINFMRVIDLAEQDKIFVEDGNHGEYRPRQDEFVNEGIPFVRPPDLIGGGIDLDKCDKINATAFERVRKGIGYGGDIVLSHRATVGRLAITSVDDSVFVTNPGTTVWRSLDPEYLDQHYLYWFMHSSAFQDQLQAEAGNTTTFPYVSLTQQRGLILGIPPINEQHAIADILGSLDDKIEANRRMNETLEATARAIFKSWFVDFDPVHAKANGDAPIGMDAETAALFPDRFEDSALGPIPAGWRVECLENICNFIMSGGTPSTKVDDYWDGGIPWLSSGETRNRFVIETDKTITELGVEESSTRLAPEWATVIASAGQGHTRGQTSLLMIETYINQSVVALGAAYPPISDLYLFFDLSRRYEELRRISDSFSSRGSLTTRILKELRILVPSTVLIDAFGRIAGPIVDQIAHNERESRTLAETRDALLPKLVSGEIRVGEL